MNTIFNSSKLLAIAAVTAACTLPAPAFAFDAAAAEALARQSGCFKCHTVDKKKEGKDGAPYKEIAAKYKGKTGVEAKLYTHITTGEKAKFPDGHEEDHKIIKTKDEKEIKNLISWILSL